MQHKLHTIQNYYFNILHYKNAKSLEQLIQYTIYSIKTMKLCQLLPPNLTLNNLQIENTLQSYIKRKSNTSKSKSYLEYKPSNSKSTLILSGPLNVTYPLIRFAVTIKSSVHIIVITSGVIKSKLTGIN